MCARRALWVLVLGSLACASPRQAATPAAPSPSDRPVLHLVSVAIAQYAAPAAPQPGALESARALRDSLRTVAGDVYELRVHALAGSAATGPAVRALLDTIARTVRASDQLVLYFRGAGSDDALHLADGGTLPPNVLGGWLAKLRTRTQFVVIDAADGAAYVHAMREKLRAPREAVRAARDLTALAAPGAPVLVNDLRGRTQTALGAELLRALGDERRESRVVLASSVATRVLERMDTPVMVYQSGRDLVLGARREAAAREDALAIRDTTPWRTTCGAACPMISVAAVEQRITLVGRAPDLSPDALVFVNGRRVRWMGSRFEVELPPGALRLPLRVRALLPDGSRLEQELPPP
jgi:hypothetical protein